MLVTAATADAPGVPRTSVEHGVASPWRRTSAILIAAWAGYSALAIAVTFPLVLHLSSRVPKDLEDSLWYVAALWWNAEVSPLSARWWDGFSFFPAVGSVAFSDHLLGASLIASPLQWLGASPITAYNLTFLASFPLCALSAHSLAFTRVRRHDAAVVCGLAYGFNPYRIAHLEHLELLLAFGMPLALAALHQYAVTRHLRWLLALAAALTVQALSASYYALFFALFAGLWVLWFIRPCAWRDALRIMAAGLLSGLVLVPIAFGYSRIHEHHNLTRDFAEVLTYSADVSSFATASALSAIWGWTSGWNGGERQLFPGLTITILVIVGMAAAVRLATASCDRLAAFSRICRVVAACLVLVAISATVAGPWRLDWGWLRLSVTVVHKPLSLAAFFALVAVALSPTMRAAFVQRSPLAFYVVAALVLFFCSLGPRPAFLGQQVLYEPPYAWLMRLPFFAEGLGSVPTVRVPARFAMPGILAVAVAASLVFARYASSRRRRVILGLVVMTGIVADGWPAQLPLPRPESGFSIPAGVAPVAVMELPMGEARPDTAAMYRTTLHGLPTINGYHSFAPLSHQILQLALADGDATVLDSLATLGPILIAVDDRADREGRWASLLAGAHGTRRLGRDGDWTLFDLLPRSKPAHGCDGHAIPVVAVHVDGDEHDVTALRDEDPATSWSTSPGQREGETVTLDLGRVESLCGIELALGNQGAFYPRMLRVETSPDAQTWQTRFLSRMGGAAFLGALEDPRDSRLFIPLRNQPARFVALRAEQSDPLYPWSIADIVVRGDDRLRRESTSTRGLTVSASGAAR